MKKTCIVIAGGGFAGLSAAMTHLLRVGRAGVDVDALAAQLQQDGAKSFVKSWNELMSVIASKSDALKKVA